MTAPVQPSTCSEDCLHIDFGCPLFLEIKGLKERQRCSLVGMLPGTCLITTLPRTVGIRNLLEQEPNVLVRYVHMGEVFGFRAETIGIIASPFPLVFLSYPATVERINLRRSSRVACHLPATLTAGGAAAEGMILDISTGGCRLTLKVDALDPSARPTVGAPVALAFPLLGAEGEAGIRGIVRNVRADREKSTLGIQFQDVPREVRDRIETYTRRVQDFIEG